MNLSWLRPQIPKYEIVSSSRRSRSEWLSERDCLLFLRDRVHSVVDVSFCFPFFFCMIVRGLTLPYVRLPLAKEALLDAGRMATNHK